MFGMLVVITLASAFIALAIVEDAKRLNKEYKRIQDEFKRIESYSIINNDWMEEATEKAFKAL